MTTLHGYLASINECKSFEALSNVVRSVESDRKLNGKDKIVAHIAIGQRREYLASVVRA